MDPYLTIERQTEAIKKQQDAVRSDYNTLQTYEEMNT